jgi:hypothetical protein
MVRDNEIRCHPAPRQQLLKNLYSLPGVKKPVNDQHLYGHEMDCADLFVALQKTGHLARWERRWDEDQRKALGDRFNVWPDRIFELDDTDDVYFLEVDRGTEEIDKQIKTKLEAYMRMGNALPGQSFRILFTAQGYRYHASDHARLQELLGHLDKLRRGNQILVGVHSEVLKDPLGNVWVSPVDPSKKLSLSGL